MKKAREYAENLSKEYAELLKEKRFASSVKNSKQEGYHTSYAGGLFKLKAATPLCGSFATRELMLGSQSGHFAGYLGEKKPCYPLRPLWLASQKCDNETVHLLCQRTIELGYNGLVLEKESLHLVEAIKDYGLKIIYKGDTFPKDVSCDYFFYEAKQRKVELVLKELKEVEATQIPLIFYLPTADNEAAEAQAEWMPYLCDEMGADSILSFSFNAGPYSDDYLPHHPFWNRLRTSPDVSYTPLMPILNIGSVGLGGGLWPSLTNDLSQEFLHRAVRHPFAGMLTLINHMPKREGLLDCSLWVASQVLWNRTPPSVSAETWFLANRPDISYVDNRKELEMIRSLALQAGKLKRLTQTKLRDQLRPEESRAVLESLMGQLKELHYKLENEDLQKTTHSIKPSLFDYYQIFERDAYRYLLHFLQHFNPPLASLLANEGAHESFWTQGGKGGANVSFLETPRRGTPGSMMEQIYNENTL